MLNPRNCKPKTMLIFLVFCCLYPAVRMSTVEGSRLLFLMNAFTVTALVLLIFGILYALVLKGDFDVTGFVAKRAFQKDYKPFSAYKEDKKEQRQGSFNYPLCVGILLLAASAVMSLFY